MTAEQNKPSLREHLRAKRVILAAPLALLLLVFVAAWPNSLGSRLAAEKKARILYLAPSGSGPMQLFITSPTADVPTSLTNAEHGVIDYVVAPEGDRLVYAQKRDDGGSDLWLLDVETNESRLILDCSGYVCSRASWAPDGLRLIYERRRLSSDSASPEAPQLRWLDPATGETLPVIDDERVQSMAARFSADGSWLSYIIPAQEQAHLYHMESGRIVGVPNRTNEPLAWHPQESRVLTTDITFRNEQVAAYIFEVDLETGEMTRLSNQEDTNDKAPAWSPDGQWIAFGRKIPRVPIGRQLWLMRPDGSESQLLTSDPESNFGPPSWSPDGRWLLAQRFRFNEPNAKPSIWVLEVETGQLTQVAQVGYAPAWLP